LRKRFTVSSSRRDRREAGAASTSAPEPSPEIVAIDPTRRRIGALLDLPREVDATRISPPTPGDIDAGRIEPPSM
jgi:hypothetical protein